MKNKGKGFQFASSKPSNQIDIDWKSLKQQDGVQIVSEREGRKVVMTKFYPLVRDEEPPYKLNFELPEGANMKGPDGKEVTLNKGDLVKVTVSTYPGGKIGFHMANVGPSDEQSSLLYAIALHKIGIGLPPAHIDKSFLVVDGNFREVN